MKKILTFVIMLLVSTSAGMCAMSNGEMTDAVYMKNQGYSDETVRLINMQIYDTHKEKEIDNGNPIGRAWRKFNAFIDPAYDDGQFGRKNTEFINRWDEI